MCRCEGRFEIGEGEFAGMRARRGRYRESERSPRSRKASVSRKQGWISMVGGVVEEER